MTLAGSILSCLYANWNLLGAGTRDSIAFPEKDWFDAQYASKPQITVSDLTEPSGRYFSYSDGTLIMHSYPRYVVNCWVPIPRGASGTAEAQLIEDMRFEVSRLILAYRNSIAAFSPIVPADNGVPRHEIDKEPRILRYEITLIGAHERTQG